MIWRELGIDEALYRIVVPRWSHAPTSGADAASKGGRFNRPGQEALYLSTSVGTAVAEYRQHAALLRPGTIVTFLVSSLRVVDFSAGFVAGRWIGLWAEYACNWRQMAFEHGIAPPCWTLSDMALEAGAAGILFPSTVDEGGTNLVLYDSSLLPPAALRVHDPGHDLPASPRAPDPTRR
ncbi:RES family NAD+ phosphorylase [Cupriavidus respiraculi]|uniref:RES family NAD+ phosphorylase n=1 Tax=Cupriavidus respiraculi TaxID=195930 RepID=UPI001C940235|nr:RES family NAD+ phosphorylase [Cupriavidus respiraculi]MBY4947676.1 RES family NAD+ phosphorylase [Cupriavidus respiraculi]